MRVALCFGQPIFQDLGLRQFIWYKLERSELSPPTSWAERH